MTSTLSKKKKSSVIEVEDKKKDPKDNSKPLFVNRMKGVVVTTSQSTPFKTLIETLNGLLNDVNFRFTPEGIFVTASNNPINSFVINLELPRNNIESYSYYSDKDVIIRGVKLSTLYKIIKNIGSNHVLGLIIEEDNIDSLKIQMSNNDKGVNTVYQMNFLNLNVENLSPMKPDRYPIVITLPSGQFQKILREATNWNSPLEIRVDSQNSLVFIIKAEGVKNETHIQEKTGFMSFMRNEKKDEIIQGIYYTDSISSFTKCSSISNTVKLYLSNDLSLMIEYDVGNLGIIQLFIPNAGTVEKKDV